MADLAVSMAKSVVEGTVTRVLSAIEEGAKLREKAQNDLVFITGEFQMMQSFLNVADEERARNGVVRTWVRQVRDLAYNVEDCIEFVIHLDNKSDCCCRCLPGFMAPELPLDKAVAEIKQLKDRVEHVSFRNMRYNLISDSGSKPVTQQQLVPGASAGATAIDMLIEARDTTKMQRGLGDLTSKLITTKMQRGLGDLTKLITKKAAGGELEVISVLGAVVNPDTTSIIREACGEPEICKNFGCRGWAKLAHPFNPSEFQRSLLIQFHTNSCLQKGHSVDVTILKKLEEAAEGQLVEEFMEKMKKEKYLVVLENISSMVEWDTVRAYLPDGKNDSRVIVSAQQSEIARFCVGEPYQVLDIKYYLAEHSVRVFYREGSQGDGDKNEQTNTEISTIDEEGSQRSGYAFYANIPTSKKNADKWLSRFPLVGRRKSQMDDLRNKIFKARVEGFPVIYVWGIAGVGKSALVRVLYYTLMRDTGKSGTSFNKYSWVDVSHPFNLRNFAWSLLLEFQSDSPQLNEISNPILCCRKLLHDDRCLVVIDGLQSTEEWDLIRHSLVPTQSKSVIIVITTEASIATHFANREEVMYNVQSLEGDDACYLFSEEVRKTSASKDDKDYKDPRLRELILKCGGLPKVILAVADFLAPITVNWINSADSLRSRFMHDLETKPEFDNLRGLFGWLHSYFRTCPDFLYYISIFPQGQIIRRRRLVRRWIAEGYSRDSCNMSAEKKGEEFFSMLLNLSIIQQPPYSVTTADTRMVLCQVNRFLREYISRKDEDFVFELEGRCTLTTQRTGRHLVINESWDRDEIVFNSIDFSQLRSLTVFGEWRPFFISKTMKVLRVLDLENATGVTCEYLERMVKLLPRLKFLSLRGMKEICCLPNSLDGLRQLETLDVRGTSIVTLRPSITKLKKLQYIRAGTIAGFTAEEQSTACALLSWLPGPRRAGPVGVKVPTEMGELTALHTLGVINIGLCQGKAILKGLKKLTQLHKLGVTGVSKKNSNEFCSAISDHPHLESLSVCFSKGNQHCLDDISSHLEKPELKPQKKRQEKPQHKPRERPLENLRSLKLHGLVNEVPIWIKHLPKLKKLDLHITISGQPNLSEVLGEIKELCILRLCVKPLQDGGGKLDFLLKKNGTEQRCYLNVKILEIACSSDLDVSFGSEAMQKLELLTARCSSGSTLKFAELKTLSKQKLKEVRLVGSVDKTLKKDLENQLNEHPKKPALRLEEERSS